MEITGFVEKIEGDVAYLTFEAEGQVWWGECPAAGLRERRRFRFKDGVISDVPDVPVDEEAISREINELLGDDDEPQDDY